MRTYSITVDFDDTIAHCTDRVFENAEPDLAVISKIRELYEAGWEIHILTARGQLSCDGDSSAAERKYGSQIQAWLTTHEVPYTSLSFQKKLTTFYVDDKALRPEEFAALDVKHFDAGLSGCRVTMIGGRVYKQDPAAISVATWYRQAKELHVQVPEVYSVVGEELCLEYINNYAADERLVAELTKKQLEVFSLLPRSGGRFTRYLDRMMSHTYGDLVCVQSAVLQGARWSSYMDAQQSFCHGDYSLDNILIKGDNTLCLIDPIPMENCYSSWIVDASKLIHSAQRKNLFLETTIVDFVLSKGVPEELLDYMVFSHWLRLYRYLPRPEVKERIHGYAKICC